MCSNSVAGSKRGKRPRSPFMLTENHIFHNFVVHNCSRAVCVVSSPSVRVYSCAHTTFITSTHAKQASESQSRSCKLTFYIVYMLVNERYGLLFMNYIHVRSVCYRHYTFLFFFWRKKNKSTLSTKVFGMEQGSNKKESVRYLERMQKTHTHGEADA